MPTRQSTNPALTRGAFAQAASGPGQATFRTPSADELTTMYAQPTVAEPGRLTYEDVVTKAAVMLGVLVATAAVVWTIQPLRILVVPGFLIMLGAVLFTFLRRPITAPLALTYSVGAGAVLGGVSALYEERFNGIVGQAVIATMACFGAVLWAYRSGRIRATPRFTRMIFIGLMAAVGLMLANLVVVLLGGTLGIRDGGPLAIIFSLAMIALATFSFVVDFDVIEKAVRSGAPSSMAWSGAFGIVVGLVWLYLEVLRLIGYMRD